MDKLLRIIDNVSERSGRYVSYLMVPLILTVVYSVIMRYYFGHIVHWAFEMSLFMFGIMVMTGGAYALQARAHVRVDILPLRVGHRWNCYLDLLSFLVIIVVCCVVIYIGSRQAWQSTLQLERSSRQTPFNPQIWWYKWFIPFSVLLLALQAFSESVKTIRSLKRGASEEQ